MENLNDIWAKASPMAGFDNIAPGVYDAVVTGATFEESKDDKPPRVSWEYTIESGDFENRKIWENNQITEKGVSFLINNLFKLGLEKPSQISQLPKVLEGALGKNVEITVKHSPKKDGSGGVWVNAYINEVINPEEMRQDDVPF